MATRKKKPQTGTIMIRLSPAQHEVMVALAAENERSLAAEVRLAVRQYLERKQAEQESGA